MPVNRKTIVGFTEYAPSARYPGFLHIARHPDGKVSIQVRTRDSCMSGYIELTEAQFAAIKLELDGEDRG